MTSGVPVQMIDLGVVSHPGRVRPRNEDAYGYEALYDAQGNPAGWIFVVADGVGGEYHGDIASSMAVRGVIEVYKGLNLQNPLMPTIDKLGESIQFTNADIYNKAVELAVAGHMGTTVVAAVLHPNGVLSVAWVGDSRLYIISRRLDRIRQVSQDHTEVAEQVRQKLITPEQAANHPRRNVLSRSVGGQPETTPEFAEGQLEATDTILICSDGLTRHLSSDHIKTLVLQSTPSEQAAHHLVGAANQLGGRDNVTTLVIHVGSRESQMDTLSTVFADPTRLTLFDTGAYVPVPNRSLSPENQQRHLKNTSGRRDYGRLAVNGVLAVILVVLVIAMGIAFLSQQPPLTANPTQDKALATEEATIDFEIVVTSEITQELLLDPTLTVNVIQTADSVGIGITQPSIAGLSPEPPIDRTPEIAETSEAVSTQINTTPSLLNAQSPVATVLAVVDLSAPQTTDVPTALPTIESVFAPLLEPYPTHVCVATLNEARVYSSVGGESPYAVLASKVLYIDDSYPYKQSGQSFNYYLARPNDGNQGAGWIKGEDLVPVRNLTPDQQAGLLLLPAMETILTQETSRGWQPGEALMITDNDPSLDIGCFPVRIELTSLDRIYIVEVDTPVTVLDTAPKSVNGAIWWNVRLSDGREGWIQQIYLDEVTGQE